jgi:PAS domain S-box-containing protein
MFGFTASEVIGRPITILIPPDRLSEEATVLNRVRSGRSIDHFETVRLHKDGHQIEISLTVSPIRSPAGVIIGASKIARDITEQNRLSRQLQLAYRLKDEFLATLSHELRTPLNAILGYARMLRGPMLQGDRRERALEIVERNADVLVRLVSDLLDMSRIVLGKVHLEFHDCDVARIAEAAIDSLRPTCLAKGVHLESDIDSRAGPVSGDRDRLQQVFWNLLTNAVKFTPTGGTVRARLKRAGSHLEFVVEDTGRGIPSEFLPHVFERFSQATTGRRVCLAASASVSPWYAISSNCTEGGSTPRARVSTKVQHSKSRFR